MTESTLQLLAEKFGLMLDWSNENVIPYLQQLAERVVQFETKQSILYLILGILFILVAIAIFVILKKNPDILDFEEFWCLFVIAAIILLIAGFLMTLSQIEDLITCKYLPEKILFRYINK